MIQRELNVVDVQGDLKGVEVEMSIDEAAAHLIMERLIRLYSDTILAFVREISTNAFDATVEAAPDAAAVLAGTADRPIHVTLPSRLAPMFIVRDMGVGMSYDDIVNVYSRYGASTKRESNDYNGALGFGCKAPLAYTPTFSVQSVRNGHRVTVQVGRTPKGGGKMTIVEGGPDNPCPTTEPNGTTVMIPVNAGDIPRVEEVARDFFRFWKPGTVLLNGAQPEHIKPLLRLNDTMAVIEGQTDYVVMANVAYPVHLVDRELRSGYSLMAEVETGAVEFTPSREGLEQTPYTRQRLNKVVEDFREATKGAIQRKISEAKTREDAMAAMIHWRSALPASARADNDTYVWKRQVLPAAWEERRLSGQEWPFVVANASSYYGGRHDLTDNLDAKRFGRDIFVVGFGTAKFTLNHKRRLEMWRNEQNDLSTDGCYVMVRGDEIPRNVRIWIDPKRIVTWKHVKDNYKLPRTGQATYSTSRKALMGSYEDVWTEAGMIGETMASDIRQDKPIYYFTTNEHYGVSMVGVVKLVAKEYTVVKLSMNRVEKFKRDFTAAKPLVSAVEAAYAAWVPTITQDIKDADAFQRVISSYGSPGGILRKLDASRVDDPKIKAGIKLAKIDLTDVHETARLFQMLIRKSLPGGGKAAKDPMESYPLIVNRHMPIHDHVYAYLNCIYTMRQAGQTI